jgi:hypothetical protein
LDYSQPFGQNKPLYYKDDSMTKININIPKPCHEDWHAMTPENKGRFCNSCQKNVVDFTSSSDREIINAFKQNENLCGRFLNTQLNRDLVKPKEKGSFWMAATTAIISLVGLNEVTAQEKAPTEQIETDILGKIAPPKAVDLEIAVSGVISDNSGPLPGAMIRIKGKSISVQTDIDGKYMIKVSKNDTLVISFVGYENQEYNINSIKNIDFNLQQNVSFKMLEGVVGLIYVKKRTFFGRIFHSIGNWFR